MLWDMLTLSVSDGIFFDFINFIFNQITFLYPVFGADYESEVIFLIWINIKNIVANYGPE